MEKNFKIVIPKHTPLSMVNPETQLQLKLPTVLVHFERSAHGDDKHSSISIIKYQLTICRHKMNT